MNIKNTILTRRIANDMFEKINSGSTRHLGIESETKWSNVRQTISGEVSFSITDFRFIHFVDAGVDRSGNKLPGSPQYKSYMRFDLLPNSRIGGAFQWTTSSEVFLDDANTASSTPYLLAHASARYQFIRNKKSKGIMTLMLHNIFDTDYASMFQINAPGTKPRYFYPGKPRSLYINVSFQHDLK
jgi:iron complex outermembrane receptor protein